MKSEKMNQALNKLSEASELIKQEWSRDPKNNHLAAGCYKCVTALIYAMSVEDKDKEKKMNPRYVFRLLVSTISLFAKHFGMKPSEALSLGEAESIDRL